MRSACVCEKMWLTTNVWAALLLLLTWTNVPDQDLPGWMLPVGDVLRMTHAAAAARYAVAGLAGAHAGRELAAELLVGLAYAGTAWFLLRVFEWEGRRRPL